MTGFSTLLFLLPPAPPPPLFVMCTDGNATEPQTILPTSLIFLSKNKTKK